MHELMHTIPFCNFFAPNCAKLCCLFLTSKRNSHNVGNILADVLPTCCLVGWVDIFWWNVGPTFSLFCRHDGRCRGNMSFGGSWQHGTTPKFPTKWGMWFLLHEGGGRKDGRLGKPISIEIIEQITKHKTYHLSTQLS